MRNSRYLTVFCVLISLNQIIALERRPNSLPESLEQVILPQEFHICNHEVNLRIETAPEIIRVAIAADSILSTVIIEVENILEKIGVLWTQLLDQKQPNEFQRQNLNALAGIVANVNGLDNKFAEILNLVDGGLSSVIDQAIGSLTSVNGLDCDCACPIPKRSIKLIEGTVLATAVDSEKEQQRLRDILKKTADNLQEAIVLGVRNCGTKIIDAEIWLSTSLIEVAATAIVRLAKVFLDAVPRGAHLLEDARQCLADNS